MVHRALLIFVVLVTAGVLLGEGVGLDLRRQRLLEAQLQANVVVVPMIVPGPDDAELPEPATAKDL